jgi:anti-anti-sigma factor
MQIREERAGNVLVVAPSGRIDSTTSEELERRLLQSLAARESRLVVDMQGVEYISSAGLRVFLVLLSRLREVKGKLVLCSLGEGVKEVFDLAGFLSIFVVEASRAEAVGRAQEAQ